MGRQNMLKLAKRIEFEQQNNLCCERSPDNLWSLNEVEVIRQQACQKGSLLHSLDHLSLSERMRWQNMKLKSDSADFSEKILFHVPSKFPFVEKKSPSYR